MLGDPQYIRAGGERRRGGEDRHHLRISQGNRPTTCSAVENRQRVRR
jgi:hypothetical protein